MKSARLANRATIRVLRLSEGTLPAYSQILLQRHRWCGALLILAIACNNPLQLACSLLGVLGAHAGPAIGATARRQGLQGYNGALIGLALPVLGFPPLTALLLSLLGGVGSTWLLRQFSPRLPPLTAPFVLIVVCLTPLLRLFTGIETTAIAAPMPNEVWLLAPLWGLGQILFVDAPFPVACVALALFLASPTGIAWALVGSALGTALAVLTGCDTSAALAGLFGFNGALTALTLSTLYRKTWPVTIIGVLSATVIQLAGAWSGMVVLTAPFILSIWLFRNVDRRPVPAPVPLG